MNPASGALTPVDPTRPLRSAGSAGSHDPPGLSVRTTGAIRGIPHHRPPVEHNGPGFRRTSQRQSRNDRFHGRRGRGTDQRTRHRRSADGGGALVPGAGLSDARLPRS